jgi:hypothetical protein
MKKILLLSILLSVSNLFSQAVNSQDFNSLTIGNVGTVITGATAGAGGLYTFASNGTAPTTATNAGNSNFQIVANDAAHDKVLQITGTNGDKGLRYVWVGGLTDAWGSRTSGNDILEFEYDFYTGAGGGTSLNTTGVYMFSTTGLVLGGFKYNTKTRVIQGYASDESTPATPTPTSTILYFFNLGASNTVLTLAANTWVRVGVSFDKTTGDVTWKGPGFNGYYTASTIGSDPDEVDFISFSGTTGTTLATINAAASTMLIDNFVTRISATDTLLGTDSLIAGTTKFSVSPNPANDFISVTNSDNILVSGISITDLNGRVVKQISYTNVSDIQVNVSDLASGMYMMNITSDKGSVTKKIVKN